MDRQTMDGRHAGTGTRIGRVASSLWAGLTSIVVRGIVQEGTDADPGR
jgi:hypothetical protein